MDGGGEPMNFWCQFLRLLHCSFVNENCSQFPPKVIMFNIPFKVLCLDLNQLCLQKIFEQHLIFKLFSYAT